MFRFLIRDVLWLTILVAVLVAWWLERRVHEQTRHRHAQTIRALKQKAAQSVSVRIVRIPARNPSGFPPGMDYQAPPQRPMRIDDGWPKIHADDSLP
jgi:hypothetical protein